MVVRKGKRLRKFLGTRHLGFGNIKNARGKGDRGGVGKAGIRKHKFTWVTAKAPELIRSKGFVRWRATRLNTITLKEISGMNGEKLEFPGYKVLSNGGIGKVVIKASAFTKKAEEKIKEKGGEAVRI